MALESDSDKDAGRAGLPFEPKRGNKRNGRDKKQAQAEGSELTADKAASNQAASKSSKKAKKASPQDASSQVSARAQAKADEILAENRRKAKDKAEAKKGTGSSASAKASRKAANSGAIPEAVSRRMLRRMTVLSGAPVFLGVGVFFLAYYLRSRQIIEFPPIAVLLVTMGCFGLGVLGLTYGVLSASWDSEPGSLVGLSEFKLNFGRVMDARKASKT